MVTRVGAARNKAKGETALDVGTLRRVGGVGEADVGQQVAFARRRWGVGARQPSVRPSRFSIVLAMTSPGPPRRADGRGRLTDGRGKWVSSSKMIEVQFRAGVARVGDQFGLGRKVAAGQGARSPGQRNTTTSPRLGVSPNSRPVSGSVIWIGSEAAP